MSLNLNKIIVAGNVGEGVKIITFNNGKKIASFSLATNEYWTDKETGERKQITTWHGVKVWNEKLVEKCEKDIKKGTSLYIEGILKKEQYEENGVKKDKAYIYVNSYSHTIQILDKRENTEQTEQKQADDNIPAGDLQPEDPNVDDDIPF